MVEVGKENGIQLRKLYKNSQNHIIALGDGKDMDVRFDQISFERARQHIINLDLREAASPDDGECQDRQDVLALYYRQKGRWHPASEDCDRIPTVDDLIPDMKSTLLCFGTISTLLGTIAATAYFVVGLAFAQVDNIEPNGAFSKYAQKPAFVAFLLFLGMGLFSSLGSIAIVAYGIVNLSGPTSNAMIYTDDLDWSDSQHIPARFNGEDTLVLQVGINWQIRRRDGLMVCTCWSGITTILSVISIFMAAILGGFLVLYEVNQYACIGFIIIAAVSFLGTFIVFTAGHQAYYGRHHLSFWQSLTEVTFSSLRDIVFPAMFHFAKKKSS